VWLVGLGGFWLALLSCKERGFDCELQQARFFCVACCEKFSRYIGCHSKISRCKRLPGRCVPAGAGPRYSLTRPFARGIQQTAAQFLCA